MTDPIIAFLNGSSALALVCISIFLALSFLIKATGRIRYIGFALIGAIAFGWTGITITFLSVSFTGINQPGVSGIISYFSYSSIPIGALCVVFVTWDVAGAPKNKKLVIIGYIIFSIVYYTVLYATFNQAVIISDTGIIYDDWITPISLTYYLLWGIVGLAAVISGIGWIKFRKGGAGEIKKRSNYLLIASGLVGFCILADTVIFISDAFIIVLSIPRIGMILGVILIYLGFKPAK